MLLIILSYPYNPQNLAKALKKLLQKKKSEVYFNLIKKLK